LSTWGSNWTLGERLFLLAGNSAKATVQAAIGGIPLSLGLAGGEEILALAGLAILLTAPLGAWAIPTFAPRLLVRGEIDPTQVSVSGTPTFLAAVDTGKESEGVLKKAADLARRSQGRLVILHVGTAMPEQQSTWQALVRDIPHEVVIRPGPVPETILRVAEDYQVSDILMGKRENHPSLLGSVSESVLSSSSIPVIIVTNSSASAPGLS
jgi:nucleotide-binding universal stress UspA family protein